jgi:hypothetical protein
LAGAETEAERRGPGAESRTLAAAWRARRDEAVGPAQGRAVPQDGRETEAGAPVLALAPAFRLTEWAVWAGGWDEAVLVGAAGPGVAAAPEAGFPG